MADTNDKQVNWDEVARGEQKYPKPAKDGGSAPAAYPKFPEQAEQKPYKG